MALQFPNHVLLVPYARLQSPDDSSVIAIQCVVVSDRSAVSSIPPTMYCLSSILILSAGNISERYNNMEGCSVL